MKLTLDTITDAKDSLEGVAAIIRSMRKLSACDNIKKIIVDTAPSRYQGK